MKLLNIKKDITQINVDKADIISINGSYEEISKIEAGLMQINGAIELLIMDKNLVASHQLAHCAFNVLNEYAKKKNLENYYDTEKWFSDELAEFGSNVKEIINIHKQKGNFFKHTNKDNPDSLTKISTEEVAMMILSAINQFKLNLGWIPPVWSEFSVWVLVVFFDENCNISDNQYKDAINMIIKTCPPVEEIGNFIEWVRKQEWFKPLLVQDSKM